ncbi:ATP-dependent nuclease [Caldicellulosiruptor sp. DIB 104C]|uniref:ATP-dependent nuclease n=1 Tax=Caldicellulosiruptor sp. DIB 104C TaxID=3019889 RepID=UPI002306D092|nr:AAA family ATPase [Caldicellulosiruptor sp. DIB 104C]
MYLHRVIIKNFRSIEYIDITFAKGKNIIVGKNNCGKSNIIKAIDLVLGESNPAYVKNENITEKDFFTYKIKDETKEEIVVTNDIFIYCELRRDEGEDIPYDMMLECSGFYKYSRSIDKDAIKSCFENEFLINPDELRYEEKQYINPKKNIDQVIEEFENKYIFAFVLKAHRNEDGDVKKDLRFFYREDENSNWTMAFSAPIRNEFLQSAIIPSFRDPMVQLRINQWSWYGKLLRHLTKNHNKDDELKKAFSRVKEIADEVFSDVKQKISNGSFNVAFPGTEILFQFSADEKPDIYKNVVIYIDDGYKSLITDKGSGIQSATIIGLFSYYINYVNTKSSALLCLEEPELYLHPHACRTINYKLDEFLNDGKNQVIITTHSPEFLKTIEPNMNIILARKNEGRTAIHQLNVKKFKDVLVDNNQNEVFFADKVIVCEGYDNYIIKWVAEELYGNKLNEENISVISVGGKDNISKFVDLTLKLGIDTYIVADFDYFLRDKDEEKVRKYKDKGAKCHESIENLGERFFISRFGEEGKKIFGLVSKIRNIIKQNYEEKFYTAKSIEDFRGEEKFDRLEAILRTLRTNGICILSGDIESFFNKDFQLVSETHKLSLEKIFEINSILNKGGKISSIFNVVEIKEFLDGIFHTSETSDGCMQGCVSV